MTSYPAWRLPVGILVPVCVYVCCVFVCQEMSQSVINMIYLFIYIFSLCVSQGIKRVDPALYSNYTNK